jgi:hypothetical protein
MEARRGAGGGRGRGTADESSPRPARAQISSGHSLRRPPAAGVESLSAFREAREPPPILTAHLARGRISAVTAAAAAERQAVDARAHELTSRLEAVDPGSAAV